MEGALKIDNMVLHQHAYMPRAIEEQVLRCAKA